jgi:hypothetical protein
MGRNPARFAFPNRPPGVLDRTSRLNPGLARVSISDPGDCGRACPASLALGAARPTRSLREMPSSQSDRRLLAPEIRESSPKLQMWKTCQAFRARYGSFVSHSTPLPSLYPQSYLADFRARLGILIIGGKKGNSPTDSLNKAARGAAFSISGGKILATFLHRPPPDRAPKGPGKVAHFHQLATVQNGPPGKPFRPDTCRSPLGRGEGGGWENKSVGSRRCWLTALPSQPRRFM